MKYFLTRRRRVAEEGWHRFAPALILSFWAIILLLQWLAPQIAFAHSELISSDPTPGETAGPNLKGIHLEFSEPVSEGSQILLFTSDFTPIPITTYHEKLYPNRINAPVSNLRTGKYIVQWTAVSRDGHEIEGSYEFRVINPSYLIHPTTLFFLFNLIILVIVIIFWQRRHKNCRSLP